MNVLIVKILAVGLTLSQLFTKPAEQFKASFNPQTDQKQVEAILNDGCQFMIKEFSADQVNFDDLFKLMMGNAESQLNISAEDKSDFDALAEVGEPEAPAVEVVTPPSEIVTPTSPAVIAQENSITKKLMGQLDLPGLYATYKQFCKREKVAQSPVHLDEVIRYYNDALKDLPAVDKLKGLKLQSSSTLLDQNDQKFTEVYTDDNRRHWISIKDLPAYVPMAFVAAEDKRFNNHNGLDIRGIVRAFKNSAGGEGRPQGGSTITQQVVKNLLVGDDLTFERKMREMVLATRTEKLLSKEEILELYVNYVFLGRASWGIEMAAQSYFGKSAKHLTQAQAALLAGLTKGPNYYHTERHGDRALARRGYVLGRMKEDHYITDEEYTAAMAEPMGLTSYVPPRTKGGFYFIDEINRQVKKLAKTVAGVTPLTSDPYIVYSTLNSEMQKATDHALQDGLLSYELQAKRARFTGVQGSLVDEIAKYKKTWQEILPTVRPKLFDVQWPLAVVTQLPGKTVVQKNGKKRTIRVGLRVGLPDGRQMPLIADTAAPGALSKVYAQALSSLKLYDLIHVNVIEDEKNPDKAKAELKIPPKVQGAIVVLENKTGKVLAMSGGFSYAQSQLNRATQTARQTGSTLKPFVYLSALNLGFQPNTLIPDRTIKFPPINKGGRPWIPSNYDGQSRGLVTIRQAIEKSLNLPTARIMAAMGPDNNPGEGLDYIQGVTRELGIYKETERVYPFVLGAQPARLIDMAVAYATVANDGLKPTPHFVDKLVRNDQVVYERPRFSLQPLPSVDRVSFYQLRRILEGTLVRGTATRMKDWAGSVAGKTGTSNDEVDAWFVGFTKDITVAVWVGYDDRHVASSLGDRFTGGRVALPIAQKVLESSFKILKERAPLPGPPDEIRDQVYEAVVNGVSEIGGVDVFRVDKVSKEVADTRTSVVTEQELATIPVLNDDADTNDDDQQAQLSPEEDQGRYAEETLPEDRYYPGAEDPQDLNRRRTRQVEPIFAQPVFFKLNGENNEESNDGSLD